MDSATILEVLKTGGTVVVLIVVGYWLITHFTTALNKVVADLKATTDAVVAGHTAAVAEVKGAFAQLNESQRRRDDAFIQLNDAKTEAIVEVGTQLTVVQMSIKSLDDKVSQYSGDTARRLEAIERGHPAGKRGITG